MTDRADTSQKDLSWGLLAKNARETVRVLGNMLVWISGAGVFLYAAGIIFAQFSFAGRWAIVWLALGWLAALTLRRNRVVRIERRQEQIRRNERSTELRLHK
jgi:hypothetical protein